MAVRLVDLERLDHTKGKGGRTAMDFLATVLERDAAERGDGEGLDGAAIDAALRVAAPRLEAGAAAALPERTTDVARDGRRQLKGLDRLVEQARDGGSGGSADDASMKAFAAAAAAAAAPLRDRLGAADAALDVLKGQRDALRDYVGETVLPVPDILEAIAAFANKLVAARAKMLAGQK